MLVRTLVTEEGERQLMFVDLTGPTPVIEPFGGVERHSTVFIDGRVALLPSPAYVTAHSIEAHPNQPPTLLPYLL